MNCTHTTCKFDEATAIYDARGLAAYSISFPEPVEADLRQRGYNRSKVEDCTMRCNARIEMLCTLMEKVVESRGAESNTLYLTPPLGVEARVINSRLISATKVFDVD